MNDHRRLPPGPGDPGWKWATQANWDQRVGDFWDPPTRKDYSVPVPNQPPVKQDGFLGRVMVEFGEKDERVSVDISDVSAIVEGQNGSSLFLLDNGIELHVPMPYDKVIDRIREVTEMIFGR